MGVYLWLRGASGDLKGQADDYSYKLHEGAGVRVDNPGPPCSITKATDLRPRG